MKSVKVKDVSVNCYQYTEYYYKETRGLYEMHKYWNRVGSTSKNTLAEISKDPPKSH